MYLPTFGGSGLLHLLAAHPRVVAIFGVAATVGALMAPQASGRLVGTAGHVERIETAIRPQIALAEERQAAAEQEAVRLFEEKDRKKLEIAVRSLLRRCGAGCTDISTDRVLGDSALLVQVLMLSELDTLARGSRTNVAQAPRPTGRAAGGTN